MTAIIWGTGFIAQKFGNAVLLSQLQFFFSGSISLVIALILGEMMSAREIIGAAIIFAAVILGQIERRPKAEENY